MLKYATLLVIGLFSLSACSPMGLNDSSRQNHAVILLQNNGLIPDEEVRTYVERVGQRIISATPAAGAEWQIYVLDTAQVNAYVLGSGSIYVTRGLLLLANSEAELAAVMAHEIAHLVANHSSARDEQLERVSQQVLGDVLAGSTQGADAQRIRSDIAGGLAAFTRSQEADADRRGLTYLTEAGYAPEAMVDFLGAMIGHGTVQALAAGARYDPTQTDILASHPAGADRLDAVRAALPADRTGDSGRNNHLDTIDGQIWGPDGRNGLIRDNRWIDPVTGLSITTPSGLAFNVGDVVVRGSDANGRYLSFARDLARGLTPGDYITQWWLPSMNPEDFGGAPSAINTRVINGRQTAYLDIPMRSLEGGLTMRLVAVALGREMLEFIMVAPSQIPNAMTGLFATVGTVSILPQAQRAGLRPTRIQIITVSQGQKVDDIVAMMRVSELPREIFFALNNLSPTAQLQAGQRLKILVQ